MTPLSKRITDFVNSPRGQQLIDQARTAAAKPDNQRRIQAVRDRLTRRR